MSYRLIIRDRATQDLRQQANYILVNGNSHAAGQFLELAEVTFTQLVDPEDGQGCAIGFLWDGGNSSVAC